MTASDHLVTRFAPSPTGHLHIGGARTALFCWAFARKNGGRFMIRIEDTDQARSSDESARGILEDLAWLNIQWDDGPTLKLADGRVIGAQARPVGSYFQAQRVPIYHAYIESLVKAGRAYPAFENAAELEAKRKTAVAAKQTYRYERPADVQPGVFNAARWDRAQKGEPHVVRFLALHEEVVVPDQVLGDVKIAAGELDDFVILKADRFPTYHFAVVIDDETMGVTHVLRAQEHLANTPRHVAMQKALKRLDTGQPFRTPVYAHMPLIFNVDGTKMSKRDKAKAARAALQARIKQDPSLTPDVLSQRLGLPAADVSGFLAKDNDSLEVASAIARVYNIALPEIEVADFRAAGYLPEAICNYLALLGWNPGMKTADGKDLEKFDNAFIAQNFSIERIGKTNSKFDRNKLLSFNGDAIVALSDDAFIDRWLAWMREFEPAAADRIAIVPRDRLAPLAAAIRPRAKTLRDGLKSASFLLRDDEAADFDPKAVEKHILADEARGLALLREFRDSLNAFHDWTAANLTAHLDAFAQAHALPNPGPIAQPLRIALTGAAVSPGLGETMAVIGKLSCLRRIDTCLKTIAP
jgi:glutamyl/glutaminyl-tRNA synthetase